MKNLKTLVSGGKFLSLFIALIVLFGCQKETDTEIEKLSSDAQNHEIFMQELLNSTESEEIKEWLSLKENDNLTDQAVRIFQSFTEEEVLESFEILHKINMFDINYADVPEIQKEVLRDDAEFSRTYRINLSNEALQKFNKTIWNLSSTENEKMSNNSDNNKRGQCTRKRIFSSGADLTNVTIWNSNCKNYYATTSCKEYFYGTYRNCQSDCDVEYEFESNYTKFRFTTKGFSLPGVAGGSTATAAAMQVYVELQYGGKAGRRTEWVNGKTHTFLLLGGTMANLFGGNWRVKSFLSMH